MNSVPPRSQYLVEVFVNTQHPREFYGTRQQQGRKTNTRAPIDSAEPVWARDNLTYTLDDPERNNHEWTYQLDLESLRRDVLANNKTLWLHTRVAAKNPLKSDPATLGIARYQQLLNLMPALTYLVDDWITITDSMPLIEFHQESELKKGAMIGDDIQ